MSSIVKRIRFVKHLMKMGYIKICPFYSTGKNNESLDSRYLKYMERKYGKYLKQLPKYEDTHKYSNKIWWCWFQGEEKAPELCKACLESLRKNAKGREIVVITIDNYSKYVDVPDYIIEKYKNGCITNTHFSDILRLELLIKYGGTWIDSSVLMTSYNKELFDADLFMFKNCRKDKDTIVSSSWFITSEVGNPILLATRDLLYEYWRKMNYLDRYFLLHLFITMVTKEYSSNWENVPMYSNVPPHVLQFKLDDNYDEKKYKQICNDSSVHKLSQKREFEGMNGTMYEHIINEYLRGKDAV